MILNIFTPTYNRIDELPGLFESIKKSVKKLENPQQNKVVWMIVDDGSDIDITDTVNNFKAVEGLEIKLIKKENGGKHTAYNIAIDNCSGDMFVCVDDDDRITENAIVDIFRLGDKYLASNYGGFVGRVVDEARNLLGNTVFEHTIVSNTIEIRDKYHFWGEPEVHFVKVLKNYRFDVFLGERFLTEAYLFDEMSTQHPFVYTNIPMMVKKYLPGGLTDNQLRIRMQCPAGCEAYYYKRKKLCKGFKNKLKATINRRRFARYAKDAPKRRWDLYEVFAVPIAWAMSIKDKHDCPGVI